MGCTEVCVEQQRSKNGWSRASKGKVREETEGAKSFKALGASVRL